MPLKPQKKSKVKTPVLLVLLIYFPPATDLANVFLETGRDSV